MNKIVHYIGLDVHKETIAVAIAPQHSTAVRRYSIIGGTPCMNARGRKSKAVTRRRAFGPPCCVVLSNLQKPAGPLPV